MGEGAGTSQGLGTAMAPCQSLPTPTLGTAAKVQSNTKATGNWPQAAFPRHTGKVVPMRVLRAAGGYVACTLISPYPILSSCSLPLPRRSTHPACYS